VNVVGIWCCWAGSTHRVAWLSHPFCKGDRHRQPSQNRVGLNAVLPHMAANDQGFLAGRHRVEALSFNGVEMVDCNMFGVDAIRVRLMETSDAPINMT
jgi:hypothetical protein